MIMELQIDLRRLYLLHGASRGRRNVAAARLPIDVRSVLFQRFISFQQPTGFQV